MNNHGKRWTKDEEEIAISPGNLGDIAEVLGRSVEAVRYRRRQVKEGFLPKNRFKEWTKDEEEFVMFSDDLEDAAIVLGRYFIDVKVKREAIKGSILPY